MMKPHMNFREHVCWDIFNRKTPETFRSARPDTPSSPHYPTFDRRFHPKYNPLPPLAWTNSQETWFCMVSREMEPPYFRDENLYKQNPDIQPKMRAILIDWLIEVCDVYKLHRKTLHMAIDYVDRYLSRSNGIQKTTLQLIGITSLFIASKNEEIYPPKLPEFCFITDGACTIEEMLAFELHMLRVLDWKLAPVTCVCWLGLFLQNHASKPGDEFLLVRYDQDVFVRASQLLDLCLMSTESLQFRYHMLASVTLSFYIDSIIAVTQITALSCEEMDDCHTWMLPFFEVLEAEGNASITCSSFNNVPKEFAHNIQTRSVNLALLEKVEAYREAPRPSHKLMGSRPSRRSQVTPNHSASAASFSVEPSNVQVLTPPKSSELKPKTNQTSAMVDQNALAVKHINLNSN
ncbi:hypothetical protein HELRODRAFT_109171 [Helobdella robusta]|uniref:Cyclin-like domain-containing protein n=1 Tax=Helobdella robusta TaxID=6412 RepID=T1EEQ9_HELRO|nr:hypothetical protein HELRODRAFT_109171 [Helobdella robusta]ESO10856.1 hypothetical protein HELRODRAFT_109171 [Helobdella robusta]